MTNLKQQTILKLKSLGISPKRSLGQNFLINPVIIEKIVNTLSKDKAQTIEIGPGLGALTDQMKLMPGFSVIELDRKFSEYWREQGVEVIEQDALKVAWNKLCANQSTQIVSNLPYQISSSIVIELSQGPDEIKQMVFMFQKEVAERITSVSDCKEYGLLSIIAQVFWDIGYVVDAQAGDFYPTPNVMSRVLSFNRHPQSSHQLSLGQRKKFLNFLKVAFKQRRKMMLNNLSQYINDGNKVGLVVRLKKWGYDEKVRSEKLTPEEFLQLFKYLELS